MILKSLTLERIKIQSVEKILVKIYLGELANAYGTKIILKPSHSSDEVFSQCFIWYVFIMNICVCLIYMKHWWSWNIAIQLAICMITIQYNRMIEKFELFHKKYIAMWPPEWKLASYPEICVQHRSFMCPIDCWCML